MAQEESHSVGNVPLRGGNSFFLIAGPCVIESEEHVLRMARAIQVVTQRLGVPFVFKSSFDKANRTSLHSYRGPGLEKGLRALRRVKEETGVPVLTDVHEVAQVEPVAQVCDVIQIPALLSRQTDLLVAAGQTGRVVNIKKGQFVSPQEVRHAVEKVRSTGNERIIVTERGSSFGYQNLVVDMRSLPVMREFAPVVFDATHSVQLPSAGKSDGHAVSGGQPQFIPVLARAAVAAGVDGVFMEVHDDPKQAKSDGPNALDLKKLRDVLRELLAVQKAAWKI